MIAIVLLAEMPEMVADGSPSGRDSAVPGMVEKSWNGFPSQAAE